MSQTYIDPQPTVKTLLSENWTADDTDDKTPEFVIIEDFAAKRYPMGFNDKDHIFIYAKTGSFERANGIGSQAKEVVESVSLDIRCPQSSTITKAHFVKVVSEVMNILDANEKNPDSNFDYIDPEKTKLNLSDKKSKIWRMVIDIKLIRTNVSKT